MIIAIQPPTLGSHTIRNILLCSGANHLNPKISQPNYENPAD